MNNTVPVILILVGAAIPAALALWLRDRAVTRGMNPEQRKAKLDSVRIEAVAAGNKVRGAVYGLAIMLGAYKAGRSEATRVVMFVLGVGILLYPWRPRKKEPSHDHSDSRAIDHE